MSTVLTLFPGLNLTMLLYGPRRKIYIDDLKADMLIGDTFSTLFPGARSGSRLLDQRERKTSKGIPRR